jgi:hypothetical protein
MLHQNEMRVNFKSKFRRQGLVMMNSNIRWPHTMRRSAAIGVKLAAAAMAIAFLATGAATANAAAHSGEPAELVRRNVPAMASPEVASRRMSTAVAGVLAASESGGQLGGHELHFQNRISGNIYTVRTQTNGAFSTMLPEGVFDLRGMHGAIIVRSVTVGQSPVNLGQVHSPGPYDFWRLVEWQEIGPAIVKSPAPATAYIPAAGEGPLPIAITPMASPPVMGAGPNGEALPPAEVMPTQIYEQTEIPSGPQAPAPRMPPPGMPPTQDSAPAPAGGY